jgi:alpha-tubulin suppressor-like RCC1 family protein
VNFFGQLGNGTTTSSSVPDAVTGINSATAVAAGGEFFTAEGHNCALLASGAVQCWGRNGSGQLGDGTNADSSVPVGVTGISTATAVAIGSSHSCALLASGAVQCWGYNFHGSLGNGTQTDSNTPVTVVGINNAKAIAVGAWFSCASLTSGAVRCWGRGGYGELGDGRQADSIVPVSVAGISTAVAITAGTYHACAVMSSGAAQCWGDNGYGQLGNSSSYGVASTPVWVRGIRAPVRLAAGFRHTCALLSDGAMRCWGLDDEGQLGNRRRTGETPHPWPVNVIGTPGVVWQSSDSSKATITDRGVATGRAVGNTTITATTAGFINDNAVLTVK